MKQPNNKTAKPAARSAQDLPLNPKDQELYQQHLNAVAGHWTPRTPYELFLVTRLARLEFLYDRAESIQFSLLDLEIDINSEKLAETFQSIDPSGLLAVGFKSMDDHSPAFRNIDRHLARLSRERKRFTELLHQARHNKEQKIKNPPNEPNNNND
jgi:hypothetical protein